MLLRFLGIFYRNKLHTNLFEPEECAGYISNLTVHTLLNMYTIMYLRTDRTGKCSFTASLTFYSSLIQSMEASFPAPQSDSYPEGQKTGVIAEVT